MEAARALRKNAAQVSRKNLAPRRSFTRSISLQTRRCANGRQPIDRNQVVRHGVLSGEPSGMLLHKVSAADQVRKVQTLAMRLLCTCTACPSKPCRGPNWLWIESHEHVHQPDSRKPHKQLVFQERPSPLHQCNLKQEKSLKNFLFFFGDPPFDGLVRVVLR